MADVVCLDSPPKIIRGIRRDVMTSKEVKSYLELQRKGYLPVLFPKRLYNGYQNYYYDENGCEDESKNHAPLKYEVCVKCGAVFSGSGGHLPRHRASCKLACKDKNRITTTGFLTKDFSRCEAEQVARILGKFCAKTTASFHLVTSNAAGEMFQELVNIGAKRRIPVPANASFPTAPTVRNSSVSLVNDKISLEKDNIKKLITQRRAVLAVDFGKRKKTDFLTVVMHYLDDDWELASRIIGFLDVSGQEKVADNIFPLLVSALSSLGIMEEDVKRCLIICDEGSNFVRAFRLNPYGGARCGSHVFSTLAKRGLILYECFRSRDARYTPTMIEKLDETAQLVKDVTTVVNHFHTYHSNQNFVLPQKAVCTRWLSEGKTFMQYVKVHENFYFLRNEVASSISDAIKRIEDKKHIFPTLCEYFSAFTEPVEVFQAEKKATIHLVHSYWKELMNKAEEWSRSTDTYLSLLGINLINVMDKKAPNFLTGFHKTCEFLNPAYMMKTNDAEKAKAVASLLEACEVFDVAPSSQQPPTEAENAVYEHFGVSQRETSLADEVSRYVTALHDSVFKFALTTELPQVERGFDVVKFWKVHGEQFPTLRRLAQICLACPASSASAERTFSRLRQILRENRESLNSETVTCLILGSSLL